MTQFCVYFLPVHGKMFPYIVICNVPVTNIPGFYKELFSSSSHKKNTKINEKNSYYEQNRLGKSRNKIDFGQSNKENNSLFSQQNCFVG